MSSKQRRSKLALVAVVAALALTSCAGTEEPNASASPTEAASSPAPSWNTEAVAEPPFVLSGKGDQDITIDFPAGFDEVSFVTLTADGDVTIDEVDYDGKTVGRLIQATEEKPNAQVFKYPSEDTPSRTSDFVVKADEDVSWALSAEAILSLDETSAPFLTSNETRAFMFTGSADSIDFITTGSGDAKLSIIAPEEERSQVFGGGRGNSGTHIDASSLSGISDFNGYVFFVDASNPDTLQWSIYFSKTELENVEVPRT